MRLSSLPIPRPSRRRLAAVAVVASSLCVAAPAAATEPPGIAQQIASGGNGIIAGNNASIPIQAQTKVCGNGVVGVAFLVPCDVIPPGSK